MSLCACVHVRIWVCVVSMLVCVCAWVYVQHSEKSFKWCRDVTRFVLKSIPLAAWDGIKVAELGAEQAESMAVSPLRERDAGWARDVAETERTDGSEGHVSMR